MFCISKKRSLFSCSKIVAFGFLAIILIGAAILSLPISSRNGTYSPFSDCLFTSTSATCVTGLTVVDTYFHWSTFGQIVILGLIQIGGLGFMTLITTVFMVLKKNISLSNRKILLQSTGAIQLSDIIRIVKCAIFITFVFEFLEQNVRN